MSQPGSGIWGGFLYVPMGFVFSKVGCGGGKMIRLDAAIRFDAFRVIASALPVGSFFRCRRIA
jgi:hypothetical protein